MATSTAPMTMKFPVVAHHRAIIRAEARDDVRLQALFQSFDLVEPITLGNSSSGGKYLSYGISVRFDGPDAMARFDEVLKQIPGLKMVL